MADRQRMYRVIENLITNAIDYSPQADRVVVRVWRRPGQAKISVRDFGCGISRSDKRHLFERFWRGQASSIHSGLGLGLYTCAEIVKHHGGSLTVRSVVGKGSIFSLTLPLAAHPVD